MESSAEKRTGSSSMSNREKNRYMELIGKKLKIARVDAGYSMQQVVNALKNEYDYHVTKGTLSKYENGLHEPSIVVVSYLSRIYNVSCDYLMRNSFILMDRTGTECHDESVRLEVFENMLPDGKLEGGRGEFIDIPYEQSKKNDYIALKMTDDSMYPAIFPGDILIIEKDFSAEVNGIYVCHCGRTQRTVVRRMACSDERGLFLRPENIYYPMMTYTRAEADDGTVKIMGRVAEVHRKL